MTPKEKAEQLVHRMMYKIQWSKVKYHTLMEAKDCSLIAVDELLNNFLSNRTTEYGRERYNFWQQVKLEIEKL
jgi:hypothetical protein